MNDLQKKIAEFMELGFSVENVAEYLDTSIPNVKRYISGAVNPPVAHLMISWLDSSVRTIKIVRKILKNPNSIAYHKMVVDGKKCPHGVENGSEEPCQICIVEKGAK